VSFRLKTIIGIAAIEAVLLAILVGSGLRWLHDSNVEQLAQRGATTARLFATTTKDAVIAMDLASLESFFNDALLVPGVVYARVLDSYGRTLAEGGESAVVARSFVTDSNPAAVDDGVFDTYAEVREGGTLFGRVEVGLSVEAFQALMDQARSGSISIAGLEMLLVGLFSLLLGTYLTRQLGQLQNASQRIAREGPGFHIPVKGRDEIARAVAAFNDMSSRLAQSNAEQRRALEASRELAARIEASEAQKAAMVRSSLDAIVTIDIDGRVVDFNGSAEQLFGYTPEEARGRALSELIIPEAQRAAHRQGMERFRATGEGALLGRRLELSALHKCGSEIPVEIAVTHFETDHGTFFTAFMRDIGAQKRAQAALEESRARAEQANEAKSRFLANMSHEIRTPLNAILNMNDLLLETELDAEQREFAHTASDAGRNLLSIVNNVLDFSKIEAGRAEQRPELCDPEEITGSVLQLLATRAYAKGLELTLLVDPEAPGAFKADPGWLRQILLNLVGNAIKFTERGGVRVRIRRETDPDATAWLRFEVVDSGIGIPTSKQSELFAEFSQADESHTRRFGGTGLGLAISRSLARLMGGDVEFESDPGAGSRFWLRLPVTEQRAAAVHAMLLVESLGRRAIVSASANPILADELTRQLIALGLNASVAISGALACVESEGCAGVVALLDDATADPDRVDVDAEDARIICLARAGSAGAGAISDGRIVSTERLPIVPTSLYRSLLRAAEEPGARNEDAGDSVVAPRIAAEDGVVTRLPILLVEDSAANRLVAVTILSKAGYSVETAENGVLAISAATGKDFGLILMDVAMPEMDGLDATRNIRELPGSRGRVPIVAMTASAFVEDKQRCLSAGMDDYLSKPVVGADLLAAAERWLTVAATADELSPD